MALLKQNKKKSLKFEIGKIQYLFKINKMSF